MNLYFDIETVPCQLAGIKEEFAAAVKAPATHKKAESIAAWLDEHREEEAEAAWLKTSFDGGLGQIVCISWALDDGDTHCLHVSDLALSGEADLLEYWFEDLTKLHRNSGTRPVLVGHNIIGFDIPFIWKRAMIHGIKPPAWFPRAPKPWSEQVIDTMTLWDPSQRSGASMDRICRLMGLPGKGGISGADVWPMVQAGKIGEVAEYCRGDVERTRAMYRRMTFAAVEKELVAA